MTAGRRRMFSENRRRKLGLLLAIILVWSVHIRRLQCITQLPVSNRRWWVRPVNRTRNAVGAFETTFLYCKNNDHELFFELTRLEVDQFDELLGIVSPALTKRSWRESLSPEFRLAFTLCYLASGNSIVSLTKYWKIGKATGFNIVRETCEVIWSHLKTTHLSPPTEEDWLNIAGTFQSRWNMPNCLGSIDGKHIRIQCPPRSGSQFFCHKEFFSLVLMAVCDPFYCFTCVDVGDFGSLHDSSVFSACPFGKAMESNSLNTPPPAPLPNTQVRVPYFFVGDEAFPLSTELMRPYPKQALVNQKTRVFNYRLSRARLVVENAFGVLAARWRVLRTSITFWPETVKSIVLATVCLHNFIMKREDHRANFKRYCPPGFVDEYDEDGKLVSDGEWRNVARTLQMPHIEELGRSGSNRAGPAAIAMRDTLASYFVSAEGQVPWQWDVVNRGFNINIPG